MARKTGATVSDWKEAGARIYRRCEDWDGSRADAQDTLDFIQNELEDVFPDVADEAGELEPEDVEEEEQTDED
jgi:hypothetical protein